MGKAVFWDFDGTLVHANESFLSELDRSLRKHGYTPEREVMRTFLKQVCSWYLPDKDYVNATGKAWWDTLLARVRQFCMELGVPENACSDICADFRENVIHYEYEVYEDAAPVLAFCRENGYRNYLLSNNYPELPGVVENLGLQTYFDGYVVSSNIGYEKPRIELFEYALRMAGWPEPCYMVGDNPVADIGGARAAGMKTVLVHRASGAAIPDYRFDCLSQIMEILD